MEVTKPMIEYNSKISKANTKGSSLKVTIPQGVVKLLNLDVGDNIIWEVSLEDSSAKVCIKKK